jgi:hypothetical protein
MVRIAEGGRRAHKEIGVMTRRDNIRKTCELFACSCAACPALTRRIALVQASEVIDRQGAGFSSLCTWAKVTVAKVNRVLRLTAPLHISPPILPVLRAGH